MMALLLFGMSASPAAAPPASMLFCGTFCRLQRNLVTVNPDRGTAALGEPDSAVPVKPHAKSVLIRCIPSSMSSVGSVHV